MLETLRSDRWLVATPHARDETATEVLRRLPEGWRRGAPLAPAGLPSFLWRDAAFALVPSVSRLGFDPAGWQPTQAEASDFAETAAAYFAEPIAIEDYLAASTSRPRDVTIGPFLCEVAARPSGALVETGPIRHADLAARVAEEGFALPSPDEWEAACAGGARTLFHWGDRAPMDRYPDAVDGWRPSPNAYGLCIAGDTYRPDILDVPGLGRGGDGGGMVCGGAGYFVAWVTLASAWCDPQTASYEEIFGEHQSVRRILRLAALLEAGP